MNIRAKKSLGQNFLINRGILGKIIAAAELKPEDIVLEIGPGRGVLTEALVAEAGRVVAVEKDHRLIEPLTHHFQTKRNIEIIEADILKFNPAAFELPAGGYKVVANIPYYITSHLLKIVFESAGWRMAPPSLLVLLVQKEVAARICAKPGNLSLLALSVQYHARPEMVASVSRGSFRPIPNVDSAVIRLYPKSYTTNPKVKKVFFELIKAGFAGKRKQLLGSLIRAFPAYSTRLTEAFEVLAVQPEVRPQDLPLDMWLRIAERLT